MNVRLTLFIVASLFAINNANAGTVDTVVVHSNAMKADYKCVVIKPTGYTKEKKYPVVFLLHGYSGWYANWVIRVPELKDYADQYNLLIVCPDGAKNGWYVDNPYDPSMQYETYVGKEIPAFIEANYSTIKDRSGWAITGLSMGGQGGMFLGLRHADRFGACGSMSGALDLKPYPGDWVKTKPVPLADSIAYTEQWNKFSVMKLVEKYPKDSVEIIFDCGVEDFLFQHNRSLHARMLELKIPHDYIERPGKHTWEYWKNSVGYQLQFFHNYFKRKNKPA